MLFAITALDKPGAEPVRKANREAHLAYLAGFGKKIVAAGPFLSDDGHMIGSLLIIEVADRAEAEAFAAGDPYAKAGLFQSVEMRVWKWVVNPPA